MSKNRCKNCGEDLTRFPLKAQPEKTLGENFWEGTIRWRNLFKIDMASLVLLLIVIGLFSGYKADIGKCDDVIEHPCVFCKETGCFNEDCLQTVETIGITLPCAGFGCEGDLFQDQNIIRGSGPIGIS